MKQQIVFCVATEYERDDAQSPNLEQHKADLERLVFDAVEKERQESMLSPSDLSANWITVDTLRIDPTDDSTAPACESTTKVSVVLEPGDQCKKHLPVIVESLVEEARRSGQCFAGETKPVDVMLAAFTRLEYMETVSVPVEFGEEQLDELVDRAYDAVDGGEYWDDPDYWERATCQHQHSEIAPQ